MDDPTDAGMEREDLGPMTSTESQVNADIVQRKDTAVCRSDIAGVDTMDAQEIDAEGSGVQPLLTTPETDSGGGAGEEEDVSGNFINYNNRYGITCFSWQKHVAYVGRFS